MLFEFLQDNRREILDICEKKFQVLAGKLERSEQLDIGIPLFLDQLVTSLKQKMNSYPHHDMLKAASNQGKEFLALGFSLSHVVHAYGSMCQAITELAVTRNAKIQAYEFSILNGCLDVAIAAAVSEYQFRSSEANEAREIRHLGFLAHELRNALSSATVAQEMIRAGIVGAGGSTANVLELNLILMRNLIDRSLSEVRMRADSDVHIEKYRLSDLVDQIVVTANMDAAKKKQSLVVDVDWKIEMENDRQFLMSAIANLVQNAIKYSKVGSKIQLLARAAEGRITIEVQDECGGIAEDKLTSLFAPYVQANENRSGLGLGLSITQRAVHLNKGAVHINNKKGFGCSFVIEMPQKMEHQRSNKQTVSGEDSIQPDLKKK